VYRFNRNAERGRRRGRDFLKPKQRLDRGTEQAAAVRWRGKPTGGKASESSALLLLAHDAAFDEHHDQPTILFVVAQAISSGCCERLALIEGLSVSCFHIVHHVPYGPLLRDSGASDTEGDEGGKSNGFHVYLLGVGSQLCDGLAQKNPNGFLAPVRTGDFGPRVQLMSIYEEFQLGTPSK
jgi:hypothetical protein